MPRESDGLPTRPSSADKAGFYHAMALNITNDEAGRLAGEVVKPAHETKTEAMRRSLLERLSPLQSRVGRIEKPSTRRLQRAAKGGRRQKAIVCPTALRRFFMKFRGTPQPSRTGSTVPRVRGSTGSGMARSSTSMVSIPPSAAESGASFAHRLASNTSLAVAGVIV